MKLSPSFALTDWAGKSWYWNPFPVLFINLTYFVIITPFCASITCWPHNKKLDIIWRTLSSSSESFILIYSVMVFSVLPPMLQTEGPDCSSCVFTLLFLGKMHKGTPPDSTKLSSELWFRQHQHEQISTCSLDLLSRYFDWLLQTTTNNNAGAPDNSFCLERYLQPCSHRQPL